MTSLRLHLLGSPRLEQNGITVKLGRRKVLALLAYLAATDQPQRRDSLIALFWPEKSANVARRNLRRNLSELRNLIGDDHVHADNNLVGFTAHDGFWVDLLRFRQLVGLVAEHDHHDGELCPDCQIHLNEAVSLYHADFLAGFGLADTPAFDDWVYFQSSALRHDLVAALRHLITWNQARQFYDKAIHLTRRWLALDPLHELVQRKLIELLAQNGETSAALRQFETSRTLLLDNLGVTPERETLQLVASIRHAAEQNSIPFQELSTHHRASDATAQSLRIVGDLPEARHFFGRQQALAQLEGWIRARNTSVIGVFGMGGLGKTTLIAELVNRLQQEQQTGDSGFQLENRYELVVWQSLRNAPDLADTISSIRQAIAPAVQPVNAQGLSEWQLFFAELSQLRCLIIFDNLESILVSEGNPGRYSTEFEDYQEFIHRFSQQNHQSSLILTSRERPYGFQRLIRDNKHVYALILEGLSEEAGQQVLQAHDVSAPSAAAALLVKRYSGNPLALHILAETVKDFYDSDLTRFNASGAPVFADIRDLLDQQFYRLTPLERTLLFWLAIEREPVPLEHLWNNLLDQSSRHQFIEAIRHLQRRSLLHRVADAQTTGFTLQGVIMEYTVDRLLDLILHEIDQFRDLGIFGREGAGIPRSHFIYLNNHALLKARGANYVKESQKQIFLRSIATILQQRYGPSGTAELLFEILASWRQSRQPRPGYLAGNILNLLIACDIEITDRNLSHLAVWQADLQAAVLHGVNLDGADLSGTEFADNFDATLSVVHLPGKDVVIAGTANGEIRIWRFSDWQLLGILSAHDDAVWALAVSPDERWLASGSSDETIRLWDLETLTEITALTGHEGAIWTLIFTLDSQLLLSSSFDQTVRIWDIDSRQQSGKLLGHANSISGLDVSINGLVATGSGDKTIRIWDLESRNEIARLEAHTDWIGPLAFTPDGKRLVSCSYDGTVKVWDVTSGQVIRTLTGHRGRISSLALSPAGQLVASGGADQTVRIWDVDSGEALHIFSGHGNYVDCLTFASDERRLISGGYDQTLRVWDVTSGRPLHTTVGHNASVSCVVFSPDGQQIASGGYDWKVRLWQAQTGRIERVLSQQSNWIWCVAYSHQGDMLASASYDHSVCLWNVENGNLLHELNGHQAWVTALAFEPTGNLLVSGGLDRTLRFWNTEIGRPARAPIQTSNYVWSLAISPDGRYLAVGGYDHFVTIYDNETGRELSRLAGHRNFVWSLDFGPDSRLLVTGSYDQTVRVWDVEAGTCLQTLTGHSGWVESVAFDPTGTFVASASYDKTVCIWEYRTGKLHLRLDGHTSMVGAVAFSPDGGRIASGSADESVKIWDVNSGSCLQTLRPDPPYAGMNIKNATGLSEAQRRALLALGAVEE